MGRKRSDGAKGRRNGGRATPRWLMKREDLDEVARRRCLMLLSVLSGERSITEAITEADISRQMYFDLETRALSGMLAALVPGKEDSAAGRLEELEQKVAELERGKRRAEKLLELTRKVVRPGTLKTAAGRPRGSRQRRRSTTRGSAPSASSTMKPVATPATSTTKSAAPVAT